MHRHNSIFKRKEYSLIAGLIELAIRKEYHSWRGEKRWQLSMFGYPNIWWYTARQKIDPK
jgi:hypothetical protein